MTEVTTTLTDPSQDAAHYPSDILLNLIVALLAPIFLEASDGDVTFARLAAIETLSAYRARSRADLIAIAQIVACGLAALGSLSLSMADGISLSMTLRLRSNAVALNRSAEANRRAIRQPTTARQTEAAGGESHPERDDPHDEAPVPASVNQPQTPVGQSQPHPQNAARVAGQTLPTVTASIAAQHAVAPVSERRITEPQDRTMWATAMTDVAREFSASLPHLSPAARREATMRAGALSSCASHLLSGAPTPMARPPLATPTSRPSQV
jgi:hypothetical protein